MEQHSQVDDLVTQALQFSAADRARIIERLASSLVTDDTPKRKPYGIIQADIAEEDIAEAQRATLDNFPRDDV